MTVIDKRYYGRLLLISIIFTILGTYDFLADGFRYLYLKGYSPSGYSYMALFYYDGLYFILPLIFIISQREKIYESIKSQLSKKTLLWILSIFTIVFLQIYIAYLYSPYKDIYLQFFQIKSIIKFFEVFVLGLIIREVFYRWFYPMLLPKELNNFFYLIIIGLFYALSFNIMTIPFYYKFLLGITSTLIFFLSRNILVSFIFTYSNLYLVYLPIRELEEFPQAMLFFLIFIPCIVMSYIYNKKGQERITLNLLIDNYKISYTISGILLIFSLFYSKVDGYLYIVDDYSNNKETYELNLYNFKGVYSKEFDMIEMTEYRIGFEGAEFEYIYIDKITPVESGLYEYNYYSVPIDIRDGIYSSYDVNEGDYYSEGSKYRITFKTKGVARGAKIVFDTVRERVNNGEQ